MTYSKTVKDGKEASKEEKENLMEKYLNQNVQQFILINYKNWKNQKIKVNQINLIKI